MKKTIAYIIYLPKMGEKVQIHAKWGKFVHFSATLQDALDYTVAQGCALVRISGRNSHLAHGSFAGHYGIAIREMDRADERGQPG